MQKSLYDAWTQISLSPALFNIKLEELRKSRDELERRVQKRTAALGRANEELRTEIAQRQQYVDQVLSKPPKMRELRAALVTVTRAERGTTPR